MLGDFSRGFAYAWSGLGALRTPGLRRFVILPVVISTAVFALIIAAMVLGFGALMDWLLAWLPDWLDWLQWLLWPLFVLVALLVAVYSFTLLANLLGAPFNGLLAARYEGLLLGKPPPQDNRALPVVILNSILHELRKLGYLVRWLLPAALLFLVPGINLIAPFTWIVLGMWLLAVEYAGYPMDNHVIGAVSQRRILARRRGLALGFGAGVMLISSVPVLNLLAMPAAVLGATRLWCEGEAGGQTMPVT